VIISCGTTNQGKLREFRLAASQFGGNFDLRSIDAPPPEENGSTFEETAIEKALHYSGYAADYVFADDSGLEVDALDGVPGVYSARFAGPKATDEDNNRLLLEKLNLPEKPHGLEKLHGVENRTARFVCAIALAKDGRIIQTFRGVVEGRIIDEPRGSHGFGYDPLFYYPPFGCTFGEASDAQKMSVSHRAQALNAMFAFLSHYEPQLDSGRSQSSSSRP
jgi:XTP/dITP diphosphohydrolase